MAQRTHSPYVNCLEFLLETSVLNFVHSSSGIHGAFPSAYVMPNVKPRTREGEKDKKTLKQHQSGASIRSCNSTASQGSRISLGSASSIASSLASSRFNRKSQSGEPERARFKVEYYGSTEIECSGQDGDVTDAILQVCGIHTFSYN